MADDFNATESAAAVAAMEAPIGDGMCVHNPQLYLEFKLLFVGCLGTSLAIISIVTNAILFRTFLCSAVFHRRQCNFTYLTALSCCDVVISFFYIWIMSIQIYAEYFESFFLFSMWHNFIRLSFALSNIAITTGSFLIVAATIERYLKTIRGKRCKHLRVFFSRHRRWGVVMAVLCGVVFRGTIFFELEVYHLEKCEGLASMGVTLSSLARNPYYELWRFWLRRLITIFLPFVSLSYFNVSIVYSLRVKENKKTIRSMMLYLAKGTPRSSINGPALPSQSFQRQQRPSSVRLRNATRMLIFVVMCYLISNVLDVFIATWEYVDQDSLMEFSTFYTISSDVSSLLSVLSSSLRLPIYVLTGDELMRTELRSSVSSVYSFGSNGSPTDSYRSKHLASRLTGPATTNGTPTTVKIIDPLSVRRQSKLLVLNGLDRDEGGPHDLDTIRGLLVRQSGTVNEIAAGKGRQAPQHKPLEKGYSVD